MRWKYLIPLAIFLVVCGFLFKGLYMDPREVPSALINKPAPEFSLPTMDGKTVTKKDLLGRVYMLNVWASWCQACQYEHPFFVKLKNEGVKTLIVGYNYRDKPMAAQQWLTALGVDPVVAAEDACRMEHVISAETFDAIRAYAARNG